MDDDDYNPLLNGGGASNGTAAKKGSKQLSVEKIYQKKSQLEHILLRPDTYIGSVEHVTELMWVFDEASSSMTQKEITYVPGLYKIFDEILVNAADNKQRDAKMDCIKIEISKEENRISVWNNGQGIPVVEHKEEKMYVPTMIFGHLLTSSNYNDEEEKVTGGRNGYGAKLCNIFSTKFVVETASKEYGKALKQTWKDNMGKTSDPSVKPSKDDYTKITFWPDLSKFKMTALDDGIYKLMERRAYDVAASTRGVKVYLNGTKLPVKNFKEYCELYLRGKTDDSGNPLKITYETVNDRWEVAVAISEKNFQQVSFVNSIATMKGGRHVDHVADHIVKHVLEITKKKNKGGMAVKPFQVKNHMFLFVNCLIVNPTFDSQTKENMTLQVKSFGSKCNPSEKFLNAVGKSGLVETVLTWAKFKAQTQLQKTSGKKSSKLKGIPKLEDANDAGTRNAIDCTLILTEGDSAKTLAVSGLGVVGRDKYGVFPLRGKLLNVREATHKQIMENVEINNIIKIMGLQHKKKYESMDDLKTLRYGRLMIMTDQDQDGSHIKGLLINFIHHFWPSLLKLPFLEEFITPIVKARKRNEEHSFYSLPEFEEWKSETPNWNSYTIKYYKGLGTSSAQEAKEYFSDMLRHRIKFNYKGDEDDFSITMAFAKKDVDKRKEWLTNWMDSCKRRAELGLPDEYLYGKNTRSVTFTDFVNKELVWFSNCDNERSIPSVVDGLKPGQRKVLFTCFKRNFKKEIKVAQLAGSVGELSAYHHGEASLMSTIIGMAQNYVGSNNINLLMPNGQFGTRLQGGKDAASPRYIFTMLSPLARALFNDKDAPLLDYLNDDNLKIEPKWYIPILPTVLINGAEGIGTGWSTKIPNHNPREVVENLRRMIRGEDPVPMKPWYKGFRGSVEYLGENRFVFYGECALLDDDKFEITELPIGRWTQDYKESVLEPMLNPTGDKVQPLITDYKEYHTDTTVRFVVSMTPEKLKKAEAENLHKVFKLQSTVTTTFMCAFDAGGVLRKYETSQEILKEFYGTRLKYYHKRKEYMEGVLEAESRKLSNQARFIVEKCDNKLTIENKKRLAMMKELQTRGYDPDPERAWKARQNAEALLEEDAAEEGDDKKDSTTKDYDYLLGMTMWNLTLEKKEELLRKRDLKLQELKDLQAKTPEDLWEEDLRNFIEVLDKTEAKEKADAESVPVKAAKGKKKAAAAETYPSAHGERIVPQLDDDTKKKVERLDAAKTGVKLPRGRKKKDGADEKDEFDALVQGKSKSLKDRLGNSPEAIEKKMKKKSTDGLKQTKLNFKKTSPKKKREWGSGSESESEPDLPDSFSSSSFSDSEREEVMPMKKRAPAKPMLSSSSDAMFDSLLSGDASQEDARPKPPRRTPSPRCASPKARSVSRSPSPPRRQRSASPASSPARSSIVDIASSEDDAPKKKKKQVVSSDEEMPKKKQVVSSDDDEPKKKKAAPKKRQLLPAAAKAAPKAKKAPAKKRVLASDSEDDDFEDSPKQKNKAKKTKKKSGSGSESDMFAEDSFDEVVKPRGGGRARKPVSYAMDLDSDSS